MVDHIYFYCICNNFNTIKLVLKPYYALEAEFLGVIDRSIHYNESTVASSFRE